MKPSTYDLRQFQEDLAALDRKNSPLARERPIPKEESAHARFLQAKAEFTALRERYDLSVADVVAFFPEEEGVAYLQGLIAEKEMKPKRRSTRSIQPPL